MIKKPANYDNVQAYSERAKLPPGGYVLKILKAEVLEYGWGEVLLLNVDIAEGEQKGFYSRDYAAQPKDGAYARKWKGTYRLILPKNDGSEKDEWNVRKLKTVMTAIEESNRGYTWNWDETTLKDKLVGGLFNLKEWKMDIYSGWYTQLKSLVKADLVRDGNFTLPKDEPYKEKKKAADAFAPVNDDPFDPGNAFEAVEEDIPF